MKLTIICNVAKKKNLEKNQQNLGFIFDGVYKHGPLLV